ncbi:MAG: hypothetical protein ACK5AZ_14200 [Bryobacteraceae bacterium]
MRVLWNEIIAFVFVVLALWTLPSTYRGIREFDGSGHSFFRVILSGFFGGMMLFFAVTSFMRAKRISRS